MAVHVSVTPAVLHWAIARSGKDLDALARSVKQVPSWVAGTASPTYPQLEKFARAASVPVGALFLQNPPVEQLDISDFRVVGGATRPDPSPNLLDTVTLCESRQEWYRDLQESVEAPPLEFVGSMNVRVDPEAAAGRLLRDLQIEPLGGVRDGPLEETFRRLTARIEALGVLVMTNGIVGSTTTRRLDFREFRGFALADRRASLVFVNGTDTRAGKIFTLLHELAHVYLGESAVSASQLRSTRLHGHEAWCNRVAAAALLPRAMVERETGDVKLSTPDAVVAALGQLSSLSGASRLTTLIRLSELDLISTALFTELFDIEQGRALEAAGRRERKSGGEFYATELVRVGHTFARAVISDARGGGTPYRDAFRLLGLRTSETFDELAVRAGTSP